MTGLRKFKQHPGSIECLVCYNGNAVIAVHGKDFFILRGGVFHRDTALTGDNLHTQCVFYIIVNGVGRNLGGQTVNKLCQKIVDIYQGEELGMTNPHFTEIDQYRDVESLNYYKILREQGKSEAETLNILAQRSRDDGRTPMQWDSSPNAGFTSGTPWIGVADNYKSINAAAQTSDADSIYSFYKAMVRLRKEHRVISEGKIEFLYPDNTDLLAYRRYDSADKEELLVLCNLTEQEIHAELPDAWATAEKLIGNYADNPSETLRPYECVVLHTTKE